MHDHYDYIITGAGCAGSSLLMRMMGHSFFKDKKILVIDQSPKTQNDRTWCFWEKDEGVFECIVYHRWNKLDFFSGNYSSTISIQPYQYKMIRGIDLYTEVKNRANTYNNIEWLYTTVESIDTIHEQAVVTTAGKKITAGYIFNSILFKDPTHKEKSEHLLLQHFKGWLIETATPCFDPGTATFMDFRIAQDEGTSFMYVLPTSSTTALVEYTLFTEELLAKERYDEALREYIGTTLNIDSYTITNEEFGVIPMTGKKFTQQQGRIINIGIAGGQAKGSSGYAFQFIQKRADQIVASLVKGDNSFSKITFADRKSLLYDRVLLNVLCNHKMNGADIFAAIFQKNPAERVLRFLDNESSIAEDLQIMRSVPTTIFLPVALREMLG